MIRVFFGSPGCGKTTLACKFLLKKQKDYSHVYGAFAHTVPGAGICDFDKLGTWTFPEHSYVADDEAGISFNCRKTGAMPQYTIAYLKYLRHYKVDFDLFSQSWEDIDIIIRRLQAELWYMYRLGPWTLCRRVYKRVMVDKNTHQIIDGYEMPSILWLLLWPLQLLGITDRRYMLTFRPFYYKYFDSWDAPELPVRTFEKED